MINSLTALLSSPDTSVFPTLIITSPAFAPAAFKEDVGENCIILFIDESSTPIAPACVIIHCFVKADLNGFKTLTVFALFI
jgi:hypothetical protein